MSHPKALFFAVILETSFSQDNKIDSDQVNRINLTFPTPKKSVAGKTRVSLLV